MSKRPWRRDDVVGLFPFEERILELWDAGLSIDQVAAATSCTAKAVRKTISQFDGGADNRLFEAMVRDGSRRLAAAIAATGKAFA
ncbi:hypothetical protein DFR49_2317 [Hephaestia caeni]|uniref:Uncharacterized protein n=1 Tax=Hephaestia caeni TaxID=645617 RepID=A0A397P3E1_9SPHN|nr:hypothetical protein [Hephaestia caeni]RIA44080.1 hypothetical protein DFR49_2317 [Hephaestia caeni]